MFRAAEERSSTKMEIVNMVSRKCSSHQSYTSDESLVIVWAECYLLALCRVSRVLSVDENQIKLSKLNRDCTVRSMSIDCANTAIEILFHQNKGSTVLLPNIPIIKKCLFFTTYTSIPFIYQAGDVTVSSTKAWQLHLQVLISLVPLLWLHSCPCRLISRCMHYAAM